MFLLLYTFEPGHPKWPPKMQRLGGRLREVALDVLIHFWKIIYGTQFLSYDMCCSMLSLKFFVYFKWHNTHSKHKRSDKLSSGPLQEVQKLNKKSLNNQPKIRAVVVYERFQLVPVTGRL